MNDPAFDILRQDDCLLAINKPSGLSTQAPPGIDSLERRVCAWLAERYSGAGTPYLGVPHRLDRPVSGVILFALTPRAARKLSQQFERRKIQKRYWACVAGQVEPAEGTWTDWVRKIPNVPRAEITAADMLDARKAVLHYQTLGQTPWGSWLEVVLETGRMHQIRLQAATRGFPVLGDTLYGSTVPFGDVVLQSESASEAALMPNDREHPIALHARSIELLHPTLQERITIIAPVPETWGELGVGNVKKT